MTQAPCKICDFYAPDCECTEHERAAYNKGWIAGCADLTPRWRRNHLTAMMGVDPDWVVFAKKDENGQYRLCRGGFAATHFMQLTPPGE